MMRILGLQESGITLASFTSSPSTHSKSRFASFSCGSFRNHTALFASVHRRDRCNRAKPGSLACPAHESSRTHLAPNIFKGMMTMKSRSRFFFSRVRSSFKYVLSDVLPGATASCLDDSTNLGLIVGWRPTDLYHRVTRATTSVAVATSPKMPPSTPIIANAALCKAGLPEAQASLTVIQRYPRSIAARNVELTHTSVVTPVMKCFNATLCQRLL